MNIFQAGASATEYPKRDATGQWKPKAVPSTSIKVLGKPLAANGVLFKALPDNEEFDATPSVSVERYEYYVNIGKHRLVSQVQCTARDNPKLDRSQLGVGEIVSLSLVDSVPVPVGWTTTAGSVNPAVSPAGASGTTFNAPSNKMNATVTAAVQGEKCSIEFGVVGPTGIKPTIRGQAEFFPPPQVAAGMFIDVVLQPTTVSFNKVQIKEPAAAAVRTGYYVNNPPPDHDNQHGADVWHSVACDNKVTSGDFDHAWSTSGAIGTQGGTYRWPISPIWRVGAADTTTDRLSGWTDQVHTLSPDGTMRIDKLGHQVIRGPNQDRGTAQ